MIEDEAKTKWCPHVSFHAVGSNGKDFPRTNAAVAWRKIPMLTVHRPAYGLSIRTDEGYRGLAGKLEV